MNRKNMEHITFSPVHYRKYYTRVAEKTIIQPFIGSVLHKKLKEHSTFYVVTKLESKNRGKNKNVIDKVTLRKIVQVSGNNIFYDPTYIGAILTLSNHQTWWPVKLKNIEWISDANHYRQYF